MTIDTREIAATIAYMIGVRRATLDTSFPDEAEIFQKLSQNQDATVIRFLCKLRTTLFIRFKKTDDAMRYDLKNLNSLEWYDHENIRQLEKWGYQIIHVNYRSEKYMLDITKLINENIDKCSGLFQDWLNWDYIRDLFYVPKYTKPSVMKSEFNKFMANLDWYPYQMYIHWSPEDLGGILSSDRKFLKILYNQHKDTFSDYSKYHDADEETKNNIYQFIETNTRIALAVDCENSDVFKLYSVLKGLDAETLSKIEKITLYDDSNTTVGWDWLSKFTHIPVEHIEVERVTDRKSLVDIKMTASVCKDYYENGITAFVIVSSDSDFWGLISSLPNANFLVMYEYAKCGQAIKDALEEHGIYYCSIDDFCSSNTGELKRTILFSELEKHIPNLLGRQPMELTQQLYADTRITAPYKEQEVFCNKYVKTLRLKLDAEGKFTIEIQK